MVKIGMGQLLVEGGEPERNFERAEAMVADARAAQCEIVLLPECFDLGWTHPSCLSEAQPIPGCYSDRLCDMGQKHGIHICAGLTEQRGDAVFNTAILVDDTGDILLKYSKINILDVAFPMYGIGDSLSVVVTKFGKVGVNICSDNYGDALDIGFVLGRMGAKLLLTPSSWTVDYSVTESENPYAKKWAEPYTMLATSFDMAVVSATAVGTILGGPYEGKKMVGCSLAVNRDGIIATGPYNEFAGELVVADVELSNTGFRGTQVGERLAARGLLAGTLSQ